MSSPAVAAFLIPSRAFRHCLGLSMRDTHRAACRAARSFKAMIAAASRPALVAPALPMASVPTGMPAGIWTMESRLSCPLSACGFDRHAEHGQGGHRRHHARQVGGPAGAGHDHLEAAVAGALGIVHQALGRAVRGDDPHLVRNVQMFKHINGMAHGLPVRLAAHDDPDQRLPCLRFGIPSPPRKKRRHYRGGPAERNEQWANR